MDATKNYTRVVIPKDDLYMDRIEAELLLMEVAGYRVKEGIAGQDSTTFFMEPSR